MANFSLSSKKDLAVLINHLDKYPLLSQKKKQTECFLNRQLNFFLKNVISNQMAYTKQLILKLQLIWVYRSAEILKSEFNDFTIYNRPVINTKYIPELRTNWVSGFVSGDGSFDINIPKDPTAKLGHRVQLRFRITQHSPPVRGGEIQS